MVARKVMVGLTMAAHLVIVSCVMVKQKPIMVDLAMGAQMVIVD